MRSGKLAANRIRATLHGIGSIADICPETSGLYQNLMPAGTQDERLEATWRRVGNHIRTACDQYEREVQGLEQVGIDLKRG